MDTCDCIWLSRIWPCELLHSQNFILFRIYDSTTSWQSFWLASQSLLWAIYFCASAVRFWNTLLFHVSFLLNLTSEYSHILQRLELQPVQIWYCSLPSPVISCHYTSHCLVTRSKRKMYMQEYFSKFCLWYWIAGIKMF